MARQLPANLVLLQLLLASFHPVIITTATPQQQEQTGGSCSCPCNPVLMAGPAGPPGNPGPPGSPGIPAVGIQGLQGKKTIQLLVKAGHIVLDCLKPEP